MKRTHTLAVMLSSQMPTIFAGILYFCVRVSSIKDHFAEVVSERWSNAGVHNSSVLFSSTKPNYNSKLTADGVGKTTTIWAFLHGRCRGLGISLFVA